MSKVLMLKTECELGIKKFCRISLFSAQDNVLLLATFCRKGMHSCLREQCLFPPFIEKSRMYVSSLSFHIDLEIDGLDLISSE